MFDLREPSHDLRGTIAISFYHLTNAVAAQLAQGSITGKTASSPRELRIPVQRITSFGLMRQITCLIAHGSAMRLRLGDKRVSTIVRNIQPFVPVGGPGMCLVQAARQFFIAGAGSYPHPERAIHVHPGAVLARQWN